MGPGRSPGHTGNRHPAPTRYGPEIIGRCRARLVPAELRLLPLLATHLSYPEIGVALFLSANTIKSQAISIYRKLGVSPRSEAVLRLRKLGLLDR